MRASVVWGCVAGGLGAGDVICWYFNFKLRTLRECCLKLLQNITGEIRFG